MLHLIYAIEFRQISNNYEIEILSTERKPFNGDNDSCIWKNCVNCPKGESKFRLYMLCLPATLYVLLRNKETYPYHRDFPSSLRLFPPLCSAMIG